MLLTRLIAVTRLLVAFGTVSSIHAGRVAAQVDMTPSKPMEVTTDTPEYCEYLLNRINELVRLAKQPAPGNVLVLRTAGQDMCADGQTRSGIMRLRSALMMMERSHGRADR